MDNPEWALFYEPMVIIWRREGEGLIPLHSLPRCDSDILGCVERRNGGDKVVKTWKGYKVHRDLIQINIQRAFKSGSTEYTIHKKSPCTLNTSLWYHMHKYYCGNQGTWRGKKKREREWEGGREEREREKEKEREREREGEREGENEYVWKDRAIKSKSYTKFGKPPSDLWE